jgi:hypothetical protein
MKFAVIYKNICNKRIILNISSSFDKRGKWYFGKKRLPA